MTNFKRHYISFIKETIGLHLDGDVEFQVDKRIREIQEFLKNHNIEDDNLYNLSEENTREIIAISTNNETAFFRDKVLYRFLEQIFLQRKKSFKLEILSLPCSTGQEPYSLAILLDRLNYQPYQYSITCADIDDRALCYAKKGLYTRFEMMRGLSEEDINKYFEHEKGKYKINKEMQKSLLFKTINLLNIDDIGNFNIVLLRNVLFYFDENLQIDILKKITSSLDSGGIIILGGGERVHCPGLEECEFEGMTYLKKI